MEFNFSDKEISEIVDKALAEFTEEYNEKIGIFLLNGYKIFEIVDIKKSLMDDDNLYYPEENEDYQQKQEQDKLVCTVVSCCLEYGRSKNVDIKTDEFFHTEEVYVKYNNSIYKCETVSGQGTFSRIELILDINKIKKTIIEWKEILDYFNLKGVKLNEKS